MTAYAGPGPLAACPQCGSPDHLIDLARNVLNARPEHGICEHCGQWSPCTERRLAEAFLGLAYGAFQRTLDPQRLASAMGSTGNCGHSSCPRDTSRHDDEAVAIAAEYNRYTVPA